MATNRQGYLLRLLKLGVLPYGLFFRERRPGLVILIYHRVGGGTDSDIDLPAGLFARQMAHLSAHHTIVAMDDVASVMTPPAGRPTDLMAVTFDDGYQDIYEHAYPVLRRYAIPATIYLATQYIETRRPFDFGGYAHNPRPPWPLTWVQIREMASSGLVTVGAHTHSHADLPRLPQRAVRDELERSRRLIEERVGVAVRHFAYPWGTLTPGVKRVVGDYFATAVRGGSGKNPFPTLDPLALWRRPVQQADGFWLFRLKLASYLDAEEYFRRLGSSRRRPPTPAAGPAQAQERPTV